MLPPPLHLSLSHSGPLPRACIRGPVIASWVSVALPRLHFRWSPDLGLRRQLRCLFGHAHQLPAPVPRPCRHSRQLCRRQPLWALRGERRKGASATREGMGRRGLCGASGVRALPQRRCSLPGVVCRRQANRVGERLVWYYISTISLPH